MGFPFADIECMGVTVIVVTDDDQELAQTMVDRLASCGRSGKSCSQNWCQLDKPWISRYRLTGL